MNVTIIKSLVVESACYETVNNWSYYYFFFGVGPPIGLQQLEKKAVGGRSAHGLFFVARGNAFDRKLVFQIPLNPPLQRGTLTPPLEKGGLGGIFILRGYPLGPGGLA